MSGEEHIFGSPAHIRKAGRDFLEAHTIEDTSVIVAMAVRNHMEDFHCDYLSDDQMKELNPLIRNAIFSALHAIEEKDATTVGYLKITTPDYWERPELVDI